MTAALTTSAGLSAFYGDVDAIFLGHTCEDSTDCCRFGVTGREPYLLPLEAFEVERACRAQGKRVPTSKGKPTGGTTSAKSSKRKLPVYASNRRCVFLNTEGRCDINASRPFGCRTFFCEKRIGPRKYPRKEVAEALRELEGLNEIFIVREIAYLRQHRISDEEARFAKPISRWFGDAIES